jgi:hypothetical protein
VVGRAVPGAPVKARRIAAALAAALVIGVLGIPANAQQTESGEILALQDGYVFLTTGKAYQTLPNVPLNDASGAPVSGPLPLGAAVSLTLDAEGRVQTITLATKDTSSMVSPIGARRSVVAITFTVRVPESTGLNDIVYLTSGESNWNPLAVRMDRVDAQHFRATITVTPGAQFRYLYTRGNSPTLERGANGLQRVPRVVNVADGRPQTIDDFVEHWGDEVGIGILPAPQATPTPYNPAPFPNLPAPIPAGARSGIAKTY